MMSEVAVWFGKPSDRTWSLISAKPPCPWPWMRAHPAQRRPAPMPTAVSRANQSRRFSSESEAAASR